MERAMVSAATGAMSSVLAKLAELLHEKYKLANRTSRSSTPSTRGGGTGCGSWPTTSRIASISLWPGSIVPAAMPAKAGSSAPSSWHGSSRKSVCLFRSLTRYKSSRLVSLRRAIDRRDTSLMASSDPAPIYL
ncbi:hypothetical protein SEVIR_2G012550v4 [Setaria viridis]|uniref:Uncharacterized protein n=1 Tax=Setaria viridis TaxID=4556 RepID=A0A4U6VNZ6_SETVI|nr:hypothetical protein SEVIR_2G012550v2 [Setaria viridis]